MNDKTSDIENFNADISTEITEKQLEQMKAEDEATEEIAGAIIAADVEKERQAEIKTREVREELIAEASRLQGRVEAFEVVSKFTTVGSLLTLKSIKENKIYKEIPNVGTWGNFCKSIGFSVNKVDEDLKNLEIFGSEFLTTVGTFGIGYRELRQLKKAASSGALEIEADSVIVDGETIPLSDKDELKEALENLVADQNRKIREKEAEIKSKSAELEDAGRKIKSKDTVIAANAETINRLSDELEKAKNTLTFSDGTHLEEDPVYQALLKLEHRADMLITELQTIAKREDLSEFHQNIYGGLFMHFFKRLDDVRVTLTDKDEAHYFDNFYLTEADKLMASNMMTPSRWMHEQNENGDDN